MLQSLFMDESKVILFVMILIRVSSFILSSSVFNSFQINASIKILLSITLSLIVFQGQPKIQVATDSMIILLAAKEVFVGLTLGLLTRFFFYAIAMGSEIVSMSMGLNSASIFNPMSGINSNLIEQFQALIATLVFFSLEGHFLLISGIVQSFDVIQIQQMSLNFSGLGEFVYWTKNLFEIAIKISAPVLCSVFLVNMAMGILGRAVPQINVFVTSFQVTVTVGFIVLFISLPLFLNEMMQILDLTQTELFKLMRSL